MIFRRSNDINTTKNIMTNNQRNAANTATRNEPELTSRAPYGAPTAPSANTTQPLSPIAMAQARRNPTGTSTGYNARTEQTRKLTVGRDISLNGEIAACDHLTVEGTVSATIKGGQVLEISETGTFSGIVDIDQADIAGKFDGTLTVQDKLVIRSTAVVTGTIYYGRLQVDTGATIDGKICNIAPAATTTGTTTTPTTAAQKTDSSYTTLSSINDQPGFLKASA
jgi:cytoskeletal protein CcmA (bactofilin family)